MNKVIIAIACVFTSFAAFAEDEDGPKMGFNHQSELGYVIAGGNSSAETLNISQNTYYNWGSELLRWTGSYLSTKSVTPVAGVALDTLPRSISAENWETALRYERIVSAMLGVYATAGISGNRFQGVQERKTGGLGLNYKISATNTFKWNFDIGYEYMRELFTEAPATGGTIHPESHFARAATNLEYAYSKAVILGLDFEFLFPFASQIAGPDDDYRINFKPYLISVLSDNFSLKVSYEGRYRNVPVIATNVNLDYIFSTTIIATY